jgi:hypothetical protein
MSALFGTTDCVPPALAERTHIDRRIGSIRRECLDYVVVLSEAHLHEILRAYADLWLLNSEMMRM